MLVCEDICLFVSQLEGDTKELFSIGQSRVDPVLYPMMNGDLLVLRDEMQISLDTNGKPTQTAPINWSGLPSAVEYVQPYVVALMPS